MANNPHKYLRNEQGKNHGFKKQRGFSNPKVEDEDEPLPPVIKPFQKDKLRLSTALLYRQRRIRREEKTLNIPVNIDLIRIHFFTVFGLDLQKKFLEKYGLSVVEYTAFNKTVLFELTNETQFGLFVGHIQQVVESPDNDSYEGKAYNLIALINNFEFITDKHRLGAISEKGFLISLISSVNQGSVTQKQLLFAFLRDQTRTISYNESFPDILEVKELSRIQLSSLVRNFDIIKHISGTRPIKLRPGMFGEERREYGFEVDTPDNLPVVGIIDTGVSSIEPLRNLFAGIAYDHTGTGAYWDESGHGTMVAGLVVFGDDFPTQILQRYRAKAKIAIIKPIHNDDDTIDIPRLLNDIRDAKRVHGVRLFNMSLNLNIVKPYNDSFSPFAYELDKLTFEEDIMILLSVGNYKSDDLKILLNERYHPSHDYPSFFYDLNSTSEDHSCWFTNIQEPSESLNNISIGALAGNLEGNNTSDTTPANEYPAYYSRKFHFDQSQLVNGTQLQRNQNNKHLNKPDIVFEGGDLFRDNAGIEVLRSPLANSEKYYARSCGTSLATPLVASLAADILFTYPGLSTQSVKALLINNTFSAAGKLPPAFQNQPINLYKKLTGFGRPAKDNLLFTDNNTAVWIIEDTIDNDELKVIPIKVPSFIAEAGNKLHVEATLCYSFLPVKDNHLNYLPLHISFGFFKNMDAGTIGTSDASTYRIKNAISWSEDFHGVEKRLFSNSQKHSFNIQPTDLAKIGNEISIAVRCIGKAEIPLINRQYIENGNHKFSIVIAISEIPENKASGRLYAELNAINEVENIAILDASIDIELE